MERLVIELKGVAVGGKPEDLKKKNIHSHRKRQFSEWFLLKYSLNPIKSIPLRLEDRAFFFLFEIPPQSLFGMFSLTRQRASQETRFRQNWWDAYRFPGRPGKACMHGPHCLLDQVDPAFPQSDVLIWCHA